MQSSRSKQFFFIFQWGTLDKLPQRGEVGVVGVGGLRWFWVVFGVAGGGMCLRPCHEMKST